MRTAKFFTILGFVLLASMSLLFVGCGSDNSPTTISGSFTDPDFVAVQGQVESLVDSTLGFVLTGMGTLRSISSGGNIDPVFYGPVFGDTDQVSVTYANGWHVINLTKSTSVFAFSILDSVRFYSNDTVSQVGTAADSLWYRHHWSYDVADKAVSYTTLNGNADFNYRDLNTNQTTINGNNDMAVDNQFVSVDSTVLRHFEFTTDVNNLVMNVTPTGWEQACPNSGTIMTTVSMTYTKDDNTAVVTNWAISMTFTDGVAAVSVSSGNAVWSYTKDVCIAIN